jgi:hypothetical protein
MSNQQEVYLAENALGDNAVLEGYTETKQSMQFQVSLLKSIKSRSVALEERLRNEINLVRLSPKFLFCISNKSRLSTSLLNAIVQSQFLLEELHKEIVPL